MTARGRESRKPERATEELFHQRLAKHAQENPTQTEYWIHTESMASALVLSMAAPIALISRDPQCPDPRAYREEAARMRHACQKGEALQLLRDLCEDIDEPLTFFQMRIRVPSEEMRKRWPDGVPYQPLKGE